jgi:hypothetical protein
MIATRTLGCILAGREFDSEKRKATKDRGDEDKERETDDITEHRPVSISARWGPSGRRLKRPEVRMIQNDGGQDRRGECPATRALRLLRCRVIRLGWLSIRVHRARLPISCHSKIGPPRVRHHRLARTHDQ